MMDYKFELNAMVAPSGEMACDYITTEASSRAVDGINENFLQLQIVQVDTEDDDLPYMVEIQSKVDYMVPYHYEDLLMLTLWVREEHLMLASDPQELSTRNTKLIDVVGIQ
jgi:hypothetical protein